MVGSIIKCSDLKIFILLGLELTICENEIFFHNEMS